MEYILRYQSKQQAAITSLLFFLIVCILTVVYRASFSSELIFLLIVVCAIIATFFYYFPSRPLLIISDTYIFIGKLYIKNIHIKIEKKDILSVTLQRLPLTRRWNSAETAYMKEGDRHLDMEKLIDPISKQISYRILHKNFIVLGFKVQPEIMKTVSRRNLKKIHATNEQLLGLAARSDKYVDTSYLSYLQDCNIIISIESLNSGDFMIKPINYDDCFEHLHKVLTTHNYPTQI